MDWTSVVTQPLGWAGFALALLFGFAARKAASATITFSCVGLAAFAIVGGWVLAYRMVDGNAVPQTLKTETLSAASAPFTGAGAQRPTVNVQASGSCAQAVGDATARDVVNNCGAPAGGKP
ncbi:hypothetical protein OKW43_008601 [Paraburkholderia sp. WC7.3g]